MKKRADVTSRWPGALKSTGIASVWIAGATLAGCAPGEETAPAVDVGALDGEAGAGVVLELSDDRPRAMFVQCGADEGCEISFSASLADPEACELLPDEDACESSADDGARAPIAEFAIETPEGDVLERAIVASAGRDEVVAEVEGGAIENGAPGHYPIELRRAPELDREVTLEFDAHWGPADSDGGDGGNGEPDGDNLLENSAFAAGAGEDGCPEGWQCVTYPDGAGEFGIAEGSDAQVGERAATWAADEGEPSAIVQQLVAAEPGEAYEVGAYARAENMDGQPYVQVLFQDGEGGVLDHERFESEGAEGEWARVEGKSAAAPAGTETLRFNLTTEDTAGSVAWDGASLVATEPDDDGGGDEPIAGVHLCDEGLSSGDAITPLLEEHVESGETVVVCPGTYELTSVDLAGTNWTLIAPEGATLRVPGGQNTLLRADGENYRVAGFVFDQTRSGASLSFNPAGDDWQVDHLAWQGEHPGGSRLMAPSVDSEGAEGLIDRVYMGDGQVEGTGSGAVWVNANRGHFGDLTFRRTYMAHFIDNALYATGVPTNGQPGRTHVEDSFFWSSTIANARTGSLGGPCFITGSVFVQDDTTQECGTGCSNPGARTTRAVWAWYGEVVVSDSDFTIDHGARLQTTEGATITEEGNRVGAEASTEPPAGVPTSPEAILDGGPGAP